MTNLIFNDTWRVAMLTLVPLICLLSVMLGIIVSSRVNDARTAQQIGGFIVIPVNGAGGKQDDPRKDDPAQILVHVDTEKPTIQVSPAWSTSTFDVTRS